MIGMLVTPIKVQLGPFANGLIIGENFAAAAALSLPGSADFLKRYSASSLHRRGGKPCSLLGLRLRDPWPLAWPFLASASSFAARLFASLTEAALLAASRFAFFAAASSFAASCFAASVSERRCSAAPFDFAAAASCLAAKSAASVAAASSAGMLTATFRRLGGAARLPFLDFLRSNLAFDFVFDFAFFGMATHVQYG